MLGRLCECVSLRAECYKHIYLKVKPDTPESAVGMPNCKLKIQALGHQKLKVKNI